MYSCSHNDVCMYAKICCIWRNAAKPTSLPQSHRIANFLQYHGGALYPSQVTREPDLGGGGGDEDLDLAERKVHAGCGFVPGPVRPDCWGGRHCQATYCAQHGE